MTIYCDGASVVAGQGPGLTPDEPFVREGCKVGRNEACPCGSGKEYKQCHGKLS